MDQLLVEILAGSHSERRGSRRNQLGNTPIDRRSDLAWSGMALKITGGDMTVAHGRSFKVKQPTPALW